MRLLARITVAAVVVTAVTVAAGTWATGMVAKATPDGHTLLLTAGLRLK